MRLFILVICLAALAIGCGGEPPRSPDNHDASDNHDAPADRGEACETFSSVYCTRAVECFGAPENGIETCTANRTEKCCGQYDACGDEISVEPDDWASCLDDMRVWPCSNYRDRSPFPATCPALDV